MKLSYRGVKYEADRSNLEVTESEVGGLYRGQNWRYRYVRHIPEPVPPRDLNYRGVAYRTGEPVVGEHNVVAQLAANISRRIPTRNRQREILDELKNNHIKNIQRSLEHRLEVARAKGDENLIRLLEEESKEMAILHY